MWNTLDFTKCFQLIDEILLKARGINDPEKKKVLEDYAADKLRILKGLAKRAL